MNEKRQLAAVMFVDLVGFTALLQEDEVAGRAARDHLRDAVDAATGQHHGRLVAFLGDGALCLFSSATAAVQAAVGIRETLQHRAAPSVRIGIHEGEVTFDDQGVLGDAVNIASRVQALAPAGGVLVTQKVYEDVRNQHSLRWTPFGAPPLKGVRDKTPLYLIEGTPRAKPAHDPHGLRRARHHGTIRVPGRHFRVLGVSTILLAVGLSTFVLWRREARVRWARNVAVPQAAQYIERGQHYPAFRLLRRAQAILPEDPTVHDLLMESTLVLTVHTTPPGANVYVRDFHEPDGWDYLGRAPITDVRLPAAILVWRATLDGYQSREELRGARRQRVDLVLNRETDAGSNLIQVAGGTPQLFGVASVQLDDFWIDSYEVTNEQFKQFVDNGGYERPDYWGNLRDGGSATSPANDGKHTFVDRTGRPGPAIWEVGTYPEGQSTYPVSGVSWYEAAAFCSAQGKLLPTIYHWYLAANLGTAHEVARFSNFASQGPVSVGSPMALGSYGTYDMAGNVKEWVWNETEGQRRFILGGAWNEPDYQSFELDAQAPSRRESTYGFRCAKYADSLAPPIAGFVPPPSRVIPRRTPVNDDVFNRYSSLYRYDSLPLDARVEWTDERSDHWRVERVTFTAGYGNERVPAVLFLPKGWAPPYQTVIYFPGAGSFSGLFPFGDGAEGQREWFLFLVRSGRAVMVPMYKGTYERYMGDVQPLNTWRDFVIYASKDLGRAIDYLETRPDIDTEKLAYFGLSAGALVGSSLLAVEKRIRVSVLLGGGLAPFSTLPEVDAQNFLPRILIPTLMVNGRQDFFYPYETAQRPMFDLLGTSPGQKKHYTVDSGHIPNDRSQWVKETLSWLDQHLGPVRGRSAAIR